MTNPYLPKLDALKTELDSYRPLPQDCLDAIRRYYRIGLTYASNALEGNTLTETETQVVLEDGITVAGKPLAHHLEAVGHADALDTLWQAIQQNTMPTVQDMRHWHKILMHFALKEHAGQYRTKPVILTGSVFEPPPVSAVPGLMHTLFETQLPTWQKSLHPVIVAALAHYQLVNIHPFLDGNGRLARLMMNYWVIHAGYSPIIIPPVLRIAYLNALRSCMDVTITPEKADTFTSFMAEVSYDSMKDYMRLVRRLLS
jgi:Fic family protein